MVKRADVLRFLSKELERGHSVSHRELAEAFGLSPEAACGHLARLWRNRLVIGISAGRKRFQFRLERGESIIHFHFCLAPRGWDRLRWYQGYV